MYRSPPLLRNKKSTVVKGSPRTPSCLLLLLSSSAKHQGLKYNVLQGQVVPVSSNVQPQYHLILHLQSSPVFPLPSPPFIASSHLAQLTLRLFSLLPSVFSDTAHNNTVSSHTLLLHTEDIAPGLRHSLTLLQPFTSHLNSLGCTPASTFFQVTHHQLLPPWLRSL